MSHITTSTSFRRVGPRRQRPPSCGCADTTSTAKAAPPLRDSHGSIQGDRLSSGDEVGCCACVSAWVARVGSEMTVLAQPLGARYCLAEVSGDLLTHALVAFKC